MKGTIRLINRVFVYLKEETLFTRTFTGRVGHAIEVDTQCDASNSSLPIRDPETETCEEQKKRHDWESDQEQRSTTKLVNGKHTGNGKKSIDETETERSKKGGDLGKTSRSEDGSRVVNNSVDTTLLSDVSLPKITPHLPAELLPEHDNGRANHSTPVTANREKFGEKVSASNNSGFFFKQNKNVVQVSGGQKLITSEPEHSLIGFFMFALGH